MIRNEPADAHASNSQLRAKQPNFIWAAISSLFFLLAPMALGQTQWSQLSDVPIGFPLTDESSAQLKVVDSDFILSAFQVPQYYYSEPSLDLIRLGIEGAPHKVSSIKQSPYSYWASRVTIEDFIVTATDRLLFGGLSEYEGAFLGELDYRYWDAFGGRTGSDVTDLLQTEVDSQGGDLWFYVNDTDLGGDPYPTRATTLWVTYRSHTGTYLAQAREGDLLQIPGYDHIQVSNESSSAGIEIVSALYGTDRNTGYTTDRLSEKIDGNNYYGYDNIMTHIAKGEGKYVMAVGPPSYYGSYYYGEESISSLFYSTDAEYWTQAELPPYVRINSLSYEEGAFVACGSFVAESYYYYPSSELGDGVVLFSNDGINWSIQLINSAETLNSTVWAGDAWITAGQSGAVWKKQGETWIKLPSPTDKNIKKLVYANGYLVIGTEDGDIYSSSEESVWAYQARLDSALINIVNNTSHFAILTRGGVWISEYATSDQVDILLQPEGRFIIPGQKVTLQVEAVGNGLSYQWYEGASGDTTRPVLGATDSAFTTPALLETHEYWVQVSNSQGYENSFSATLRMQSWPKITDQPDNLEIEIGRYGYPRVSATGENLSYQWFYGFSGDTSLPVHGATSSSLSVLQTSTAYSYYWVRVSNEIGFTDSSTARISGLLIPPRIQTQPLDKRIFAGATSSTYVSAVGSNLSYQWFRGQSGDTSSPLEQQGSSLAVYHDVQGVYEYWVRVSNPAGHVDSRTVEYEIQPGRTPVISRSPISTSAYVGGSISISVTSHGSGRKYQWYAGESGDTSLPLNNATSSSFTPSTLFVGTTPYWVRVYNDFGHVDSDTAYISVFAESLTSVKKQPLDFTTYRGSSTAYTKFTIELSAPEDATAYQWFIGSSGDTSTPVSGATNSTFTPSLSVVGTFSYWVRVTTISGSIDSRTAIAEILPALFRITAQPADLYEFVDKGYSSSISVGATGENLTYQWYQGLAGDTSSPLLDKTSNYFSPPFEGVGEKQYWVRITSGEMSLDSRTVTHEILDSYPYIYRQPKNKEVLTGKTTRIYVGVNSSSRMSYQWYEGESGDTSSPVVGETAYDLDVPAKPMGQYKYWVRVIGATNWIDSDTATVTFQPADYSVWASHYGIVDDDPGGSTSGDGISDIMKYAMGLDPATHYYSDVLSKQIMTIGNQEYFTISFQLRDSLNGVAVYVEATGDLADGSSWATTPVDMGPTIDNGDGTSTYTFRTLNPIGLTSRFLRVSVEAAP